MSQDCLFCKIVAAKIPASITYQDNEIMAFNDIHPRAPIHQLIIPKKHIATLNDAEDASLLGRLLLTAKQLATTMNVAESGYRIVVNCNPQGGQEVYHLHIHLLAQRQMTWPPG